MGKIWRFILGGFGILSIIGVILGIKDGRKRGEEAIQKAGFEDCMNELNSSTKRLEGLSERLKQSDLDREKIMEKCKADLKDHHTTIMDNLDKIKNGGLSKKETDRLWKDVDYHQKAMMKIYHETLSGPDGKEDEKDISGTSYDEYAKDWLK